jgi:ribosomal protein S18 acetylase RimI-like enzyme
MKQFSTTSISTGYWSRDERKTAGFPAVLRYTLSLMNIEIRRARPEDAESYLRVMRDTAFSTYVNNEAGITKEELEKSYDGVLDPSTIQKHAERFSSSPETALRLVAEADGKIIGIAKGRIADPHNFFDTLYIIPEFQDQGIGTLLFNKVMEFLGMDRTVELEVASYNERAIGFYKHHGFVETESTLTRPIYEGGPEQPLLIMERTFDFGK